MGLPGAGAGAALLYRVGGAAAGLVL